MENNKINPFKVMVNPRRFIHEGLAKTNQASIVIAWLIGMTYLFGKAYTFGLGNTYMTGPMILFCVVFSVPVGYVTLYITSFFLYWVGKLFRGGATFEEVFAAYVWTRVPEIFILLSWFGLISVFGRFTFTTLVITTTPMPIFVVTLIVIQMVFAIWEAVILFHALGEVQRLSAWIVVWNVVFTWVILFFVDLVFNWFLVKGFGLKPIANLLFL